MCFATVVFVGVDSCSLAEEDTCKLRMDQHKLI